MGWPGGSGLIIHVSIALSTINVTRTVSLCCMGCDDSLLAGGETRHDRRVNLLRWPVGSDVDIQAQSSSSDADRGLI